MCVNVAANDSRTSNGQGIVCHGLILAGGQSARMGQDKALLHIDGRPLLAGLIVAMRKSVQGDIVVAVQSPEREALYRSRLGPLPAGVRFACDRVPEAGPLAGLAAGLAALPGGYAFTTACDSPELPDRWLARLLEEATAGPDLLAVAAKGEPLHALYHTGVARLAEETLAAGDYRLMSLLRRAGAKELELTGREKEDYGLHNLNTPEQLERYLAGRNHRIEDRTGQDDKRADWD